MFLAHLVVVKWCLLVVYLSKCDVPVCRKAMQGHGFLFGRDGW